MKYKELDKQFFEEPYRFDFFQAVRLLERIQEGKLPVGGAAMPAQEIVRFHSRVGLDFPASEIHEVTKNSDQDRLDMIVSFMGMLGVNGAMPTHYTELAAERRRYKDTAFIDFIDIFTHRCVSLFWRAWAKYRFPVQYERGNDDFTSYLYDFVGLGTVGLRGRQAVDDEALLPYAGLISQRPHSNNALENIVSDYFGVKAKVEQLFGQWIELDAESVSVLGRKNYCLGETAIIGNRVWDQQSKFRITLGPLNFNQFSDFLPDGEANAKLRSIVALMTGLEIDYDFKLVLKAKEVPGTVLTTRAKRKPKLGWTSYLKSKPFKEDDDQLVLSGDKSS